MKLSSFPNTFITLIHDSNKKAPLIDKSKLKASEIPPCYGTFFTVNGFKGARKKQNLTHITGAFADFDYKGVPIPELQNMPFDWVENAPNIVNRTKNGYHCIWMLEETIVVTDDNREELIDTIEGIHRYMRDNWGADGGAIDVGHLIRVPGTEHRKNPKDPFIIKTVHEDDSYRTLAELVTLFPPVAKPLVVADYDKGDDDFDIRQTAVDVWAEKGQVATFNSKGHLILDGVTTATFIGRQGASNYMATTSDEFPAKGNATTYVAGVLGITTKEAYKWLGNKYGFPVASTTSDSIPSRDRYLEHLALGNWDDDDWKKELKLRAMAYFVDFYLYIQQQHPHLKFEIGLDKSFWNYNKDEGIYEPLAYSTMIGLIIKEMRSEDMDALTTEGNARRILINFMADGKRGVTLDSFIHGDDMLHVNNGWLERSTLILHPHTPDKLSLFKMAVDYDKEATCPLYDKFLDVDSEQPKDQIRVVDQFSGLLLTDNINEQTMLILEGRPGCAKSMLPELWMEILGRKATTKSLANLDSGKTRFIGDSLAHRTLCWFDEANPKTANVNEFFMGLITNKMLEIERKGVNSIEYVRNTLKLVMSLNEMPDHMPEGMKRRYRHILFTRSFTDDGTVDRRYQDKIRTTELSGVLNRMLKGLVDYQMMGGITVIAGEEERKDAYNLASDDISAFISEHFEPVRDAEVRYSFKEMRDAFATEFPKTYNKGLSVHAFNKKLLSVRLPAFKHVRVGRNNRGQGRGYIGLVLKDDHKFSQYKDSPIEVGDSEAF